MPDEDKNFGGSLVLDFRKWWRHVKTIYSEHKFTRRCILHFSSLAKHILRIKTEMTTWSFTWATWASPWERRKQSQPVTFSSTIRLQFKISASPKKNTRPGWFMCRLIPPAGVVRSNDFTARKMMVRHAWINILLICISAHAQFCTHSVFTSWFHKFNSRCFCSPFLYNVCKGWKTLLLRNTHRKQRIEIKFSRTFKNEPIHSFWSFDRRIIYSPRRIAAEANHNSTHDVPWDAHTSKGIN